MSKDLIKGSLEDIETLNSAEKKQLNHLCNTVIDDIGKKNGKPNRINIDLNKKNEGEYKIELLAKRIAKRKSSTSEVKLKAIGLAESNETKLIKKINNGEINNNHITNISKADIDNALVKLPPEKQKKVIETIIKNTNERHLINREEIASESTKDGNINLMTIENWYKGIIRAANQFESKLYINEEMLEFLSKEQVEHLYNLINQINGKCNEFMKSLYP